MLGLHLEIVNETNLMPLQLLYVFRLLSNTNFVYIPSFFSMDKKLSRHSCKFSLFLFLEDVLKIKNKHLVFHRTTKAIVGNLKIFVQPRFDFQ